MQLKRKAKLPTVNRCDQSTQTQSFFQIIIHILLDFWLTVKAATLIFISGCGSTISSAKEGKSGFIYNLVKSY